jgi:biopolymer transport protein ExbB
MDITEMVVRLSRTGAGTAVMWFMVLLSVFSVAVMIERLLFFQRNQGNVRELGGKLNKLFIQGHYSEAKKLLGQTKGFEASVLSAAIDGAPLGPHAVRELADGAAKIEKLRYERGLAFLGTLGNNAPFIGLFGTVLEIIAALFELGTQSSANASAGAVMATLSAALAATAVGLLVAMPAVAVFNYFNRRMTTLQSSADALVHILLAHLRPEEPSQPAPERAAA